MESPNTVITTPPMPGQSTTSNVTSIGCQTEAAPSGLECLRNLDKIIISHKIGSSEDPNQKDGYSLLRWDKLHLFDVKEDPSFTERTWFGRSKEYHITIYDNLHQPVLQLHRPLEPRDKDYLEVRSGERLIGTIYEDYVIYASTFEVHDELGTLIFEINSNCSSWLGFSKFEVTDVRTEEEIGFVSKGWSASYKELLTFTDKFSVMFPATLSLDHKALLIGSAIFIDHRFSEYF